MCIAEVDVKNADGTCVGPMATVARECSNADPNVLDRRAVNDTAPEPRWFRIANGAVDNGLVARLPGSALRVWLLMLRMANRKGTCWPTLAQLAQRSRVNRATVSRAITRLINEGAIARLEAGKKGRATEYQLLAAGGQVGRTDSQASAVAGDLGSGSMSPCRTAEAISATAASVHKVRRTKAAPTRLKNKTKRSSNISAAASQTLRGYHWDITSGFHLSDTALADLRECFPLLNIDQQLRQADAWLKANSARSQKKSDWARFVTNWLLRSTRYERMVQRTSTGGHSADQHWHGRHYRDRALQL